MTATTPIALARNRRTAAFERRVARVLDAHLRPDATVLDAHLRPDATVLVACSGGPDSLATLVAVARSRPSGSVIAAHFDHRLRAASEVAGERALVEAVATAAGARFVAGRAPRIPADRGEAAAREARYRWLARAAAAAAPAACITGHTLDDQAETVLLRLARGTGLRGAAGMDERAPWPVATRGRAPFLVRPLLGLTRVEVQGYLDALGIEAAQDPSNDTLDFARNRVRQRVVPELCALNPRASRQIAAFAARAREDEAALEAWATAAFATLARPGPDEIALDSAGLLDLPAAVSARVVRHAAARLGVALEREQVGAALHAARARGRQAALGGGVTASRSGACLLLRRTRANSSKSALTR